MHWIAASIASLCNNYSSGYTQDFTEFNPH